MASLNKLMLSGNLTRDPELRHTPKGNSITEISIAINRTWTNDHGQKQEDVTFVDVTFWGRAGEVIHTHMAKGAPIYIEGRLQLDTWDDKETGKKRSKLRVIGEQFQFLASKQSNDPSPPRQPREPAHQSATSDNLDQPPDDDDIPF